MGLCPKPHRGAVVQRPLRLPRAAGVNPLHPHGHNLHNARKGTVDCASDNRDLVRSIIRLDRSNAGRSGTWGVHDAQALWGPRVGRRSPLPIKRSTYRIRSHCLRGDPRSPRAVAPSPTVGGQGVSPPVSLGKPKGVGQATPAVGLGAKPHSNVLIP